jgi:hypothetical protein
MHLIAMLGCPAVSLFSGTTDPVRSAPRGPRVSILQERNLDMLPAGAVVDAFFSNKR